MARTAAARPRLIAKRPPPGPPGTWEFPSFTRRRLDNGLQVIVAHVPGHPLSAARLILEAGAGCEPDQEGGVAAIAARAITEGTEVHKGPAFIQAAERLGADINGACDWDSFTVTVRVPEGRLEPALELLAESVQRPQFPWREVDRLRQERLAVIMQEYANATTRARIASDKLIYSTQSSYSRSDQGAFWPVFELGKRRVRKYFRQYATPGSATLILVGDLEGLPAEKIAEEHFGGWKGKESDRPEPAIYDGLPKTTILLVHRPDSEQSQLDIGHIGAPRSTPDYFPITVMGTALGGLFNSRLNMKLREEKGFTYGASAGFQFRRKAGPFRASTAVDTPVTVEAIADTIEVIRKTHEEGITQEELDEVKGFLTGVFPLAFETPEAIAAGLSSLVIHGLPDDYYQTYRANVEKVTLDEANAAAAKYLRPDRIGVVAVGDAEKIREPLLEAEFGPVAVIEDPEPGKPPTH